MSWAGKGEKGTEPSVTGVLGLSGLFSAGDGCEEAWKAAWGLPVTKWAINPVLRARERMISDSSAGHRGKLTLSFQAQEAEF